MKNIDLTGKVALVTGGGQGLGLATTKALVEAGANVVINYFDDKEGLNKGVAEAAAQELGDRVVPMKADVRSIEETQAMLDAVHDKYGRIDIVVNNAGIVRDKTLKKMSPAEWQQVIDTNLTGVFNVCRSAIDKLSDGGRIVNLSSISGIIGFFGQSNYAASKAGVIGLSKVLSREVGRKGITVNAVAPGVILTEMGKTIPEDVQAEMMKNIPLNKFGEPEDVANAILFLCSDMAKYMTGQVLQVNGGWIG